ncbi:MAG: hypothetical protein E6R14_05340 [Thermomicrobiales bacterium]|nr:MAG: hypothetical protein E6R14_05340 [Thermomicrobiales bacterium]
MIFRFGWWTACMIVCLTPSSPAHAAPTEVEQTGDLVVRYSQRLNEQLQALEKSLQEQRVGRTKRTQASIESAKAYEAHTADIRDLWAVSQDKTALQLFESVRATRKRSQGTDGPEPKNDIPASSQQTLFYNPEPLETTIKKVLDLTRSESAKERATFAFEFAKGVWTQVKKQQESAAKLTVETSE